MRAVIFILAAATCVASAATPTFPQKRALTPEGIKTVGQVPVVVAEINRGIEKTWHDKQTRGGGYTPTPVGADPVAELAGHIIAAGIIEALRDRGPARRAQRAADEVAARLPASALQASLLQHLAATANAGSPVADGISFGAVSTVQKVLKPKPIDDALEIESSYVLSEDGSAFRAVFVAHYRSSKLTYVTPHEFAGKPPKSERQGPIYSNVFLYRSNRLPIPRYDSSYQSALVAAVEQSYRDDQGELPAPGSKDAKAMAKELEDANDGNYTQDEVAIILTQQWLAEDGKLLKQQVEDAHAFFARYLLQDLNSTEVPPMSGNPVELETAPGEWIVRRLNSGASSGTYERIPDASGDVTQYASYGNANAISMSQQRRIQNLKQYAEKQKTHFERYN